MTEARDPSIAGSARISSEIRLDASRYLSFSRISSRPPRNPSNDATTPAPAGATRTAFVG